ncbi:MAG: DNA polymerase III subunit beta [Bacilli bacterium]|nr:DNA polymerase III subunit beta [Bacilli bacterium]
MKFSINRDFLLTNLNHVARALSNKPQMPILTGIKIDVRKDFVLLTASNSDISIQTKLQNPNLILIEEEGVVVLPGKFLLEITRKVESKNVDFMTFEENMVKILAERSNFTLNVLDKDAFPMIAFDESDIHLTMDVLNLKQIIKKTTFAASVSETRMVLTGISFAANENTLEAIATDSFRLAKKYMVFEKTHPKINVIIPSRSLDELNKVMEELEEAVHIHFSNTKILFKYKNILFQSRLIEGTFPNTNSLIPNVFMTSIKFNKQELIATIDRASLFNSIETTNIIKLTLTSDKIVEISSTSNEVGAALEEVYPLECSSLVPFQIAFSSKFFLDALRSFDSAEITIHFTGEIKPFIITGEYDVNHVQLILPVRVA